MAKFKIEISSTAEKSLKKLPKRDIGKIVSTIQNLANDPYPAGCRKLTGEENVYRVKQGNYRVLYEVKGKTLIILILKIAQRKDVYK